MEGETLVSSWWLSPLLLYRCLQMHFSTHRCSSRELQRWRALGSHYLLSQTSLESSPVSTASATAQHPVLLNFFIKGVKMRRDCCCICVVHRRCFCVSSSLASPALPASFACYCRSPFPDCSARIHDSSSFPVLWRMPQSLSNAPHLFYLPESLI